MGGHEHIRIQAHAVAGDGRLEYLRIGLIIGRIANDRPALTAPTITWQQAPDHWMRGVLAMPRMYATQCHLSLSHA